MHRDSQVLLFGATGLIGAHLLRQLLALPDAPRVAAITRRPLDIAHPRLSNPVGDLTSLGGAGWPTAADTAFCCLGTTLKDAGSKEGFYAVDHDLVLRCARWAKDLGVRHFLAVSAIGVSEKSPVFYNRVKAETERDLAALGFAQLTLMQPSLLMGERSGRTRPGEAIGLAVMPLLNPLLVGGLSKYSAVRGEDVARAMLNRARRPSGAPVERLRYADFMRLQRAG